MTTHTAVTMQDLELESAELLPARETLWCHKSYPGSSYSYSVTQIGSYDGNTQQEGLLNISVLNGNLDGDGNFVL